MPDLKRINVDTLKSIYLLGISLKDSDGKDYPEEFFRHYLDSAKETTQNTFRVSLDAHTVVDEEHDFFGSDYANWAYLKLFKRPVKKVSSMGMWFGAEEILKVPENWLKVTKLTGELQFMPGSGALEGLIITRSGGLFNPLVSAYAYAPKMWKVTYDIGFSDYKVSSINVVSGGSGYTSNTQVSILNGGGSGAYAEAVVNVEGVVTSINLLEYGIGYTSTPNVIITGSGSGAEAVAVLSDGVPENMKEYVYKMASVSILEKVGQLIAGAGVSGGSIGLDGLSQALNLTKAANASAFAATCTDYKNDLKELYEVLSKAYNGMNFGVV